jgi:hypothetical protein
MKAGVLKAASELKTLEATGTLPGCCRSPRPATVPLAGSDRSTMAGTVNDPSEVRAMQVELAPTVLVAERLTELMPWMST